MSDVSVTAHRHTWRLRATVDGCHFTEARSYCPSCGAQRAEFHDRDFSDPNSIVFADRTCPRCQQLATAAGYQEGDWSWRLR